MGNWYLRRLTQALFTMWAVVTITFFIIRYLPGGPLDYLRAELVAQGADTTRINELVEVQTNIRPDTSVWNQYIDYVGALFQGDFGESIWYSEPVESIIIDAIPWTVFIMTITMICIFSVGIVFGAVLAYKEGSLFDSSGTVASTVLASIPFYIAAILLLFVFGFQLGMFPTGGRAPDNVTAGFNLSFILGVLHHATLPIAAMVITGFGSRVLAMRGNSISILGDDYLYVARLRGLSEWRISTRYVARNAILPMYTDFLLAIGFMFGGAVINEEIFGYRGMGFYMFKALDTRDYPLMMGAFLIISLAVVIAVFFADLTYGWLDPKAGKGGDL